MTKALLVVNMPSKCSMCRLCCNVKTQYDMIFDIYRYCSVLGEKIESEIGRLESCPLKPIPERKEFDNQIPYKKSGYNDCLDDILGESHD